MVSSSGQEGGGELGAPMPAGQGGAVKGSYLSLWKECFKEACGIWVLLPWKVPFEVPGPTAQERSAAEWK